MKYFRVFRGQLDWIKTSSTKITKGTKELDDNMHPLSFKDRQADYAKDFFVLFVSFVDSLIGLKHRPRKSRKARKNGITTCTY